MKRFLTILLAVLMLACFAIGLVGCASHKCDNCGKEGASHKYTVPILGNELWLCGDCAKGCGMN